MKKTTISKILGLAVTIAILASMIVGVIPVSAALTISPVVLSSNVISNGNTTYTLNFTGSFSLVNTDYIVVTFPADTSTTMVAEVAVPAATLTTFAIGEAYVCTTAGNLFGDGTLAGNFNGGAAAVLAAPQAVVVGDSFVATVAGTILVTTTSVGVKTPVIFNNGAAGNTVYTATRLNAGQTVAAARIVAIALPTPSDNTATVGDTWSLKIAGVTNPTAPGTAYTLTIGTKNVANSAKDADTASGAYTISVPVVASRYNKAGNFVGSYTGTTALATSIAAIATDDTLKLGPGTYAETTTTPGTTTRVTITSSSGTAADTIIKGTLTIAGGDTYVTISNLTFQGKVALNAAGTNHSITNCVFTKAAPFAAVVPQLDINTASTTVTNTTFDTSGGTSLDTCIRMNNAAATATITSCTFTLDQDSALANDIGVQVAAALGANALTVDKGTFIGASGIGFSDTFAGAGATTWTVKASTFTSLDKAFDLNTAAIKGVIDGNTITKGNNALTGVIDIGTTAATAGADIRVIGNTIKDNLGFSIRIAGAGTAACVTVTGNDFSGNVKGFSQADTTAAAPNLKAQLNWWGASSGPTIASNPTGAGDKIVGDGTITYKPFITSTSSAAKSHVGTAGPDAWDDSTSAGVAIGGFTSAAALVTGQKLDANPKTIQPPFPALNYFDIYTSAASTTAMQVKFYATGVTPNSAAYVWSSLTNGWQKCSSQGVAGTGDYVWVNINPNAAGFATTTPFTGDLVGTAFAVLNGAAPVAPSFAITAPVAGSTSALTNVTFAWTAVADANTYEFILSAKSDFSAPVVDTKVPGTAYAYTGTLTDATAYFWKVVAFRDTTKLAESASGVFTAQAPVKVVVPTTSAAPPVIITQVPAPTFTIPPAPTVTVSIPPAAPVQQITPAWIWGIIGVGAILVIVVIVLIVRTRRTA